MTKTVEPTEAALEICKAWRLCIGITLEEVIKHWLKDPRTSAWAQDANPAEFQRIWLAGDMTHIMNLTEDGVALAFAERFRDQLRYDHDVRSWFQWTETYWRQERTELAFSWARATCRDVAVRGQAVDERGARALKRAATAAGVERFAQSDRTFAVTSEIWDQDPMLVGTPGGTVDLVTCELRPARPEDYITKQTAVAPAEVPECRLWDAFLRDATGKDEKLIRFLRQWAGYCLTGAVHEHALVFIWGPGGNGKSVFMNTLAHVMGDYAVTSSMDTFAATTRDRHPTDLAALRGARLVTVSETEEGRAWSETRVKQLTGGDKIAARFMRQDFFEYEPQFKLCVVGNNKPVLRSVDPAIKRRINMLPFINKPESPDSELEQKLRAEAPQILRWAIEGCLDWQMHGLVKPDVVVDATKEYFQGQDHFGRWLAECYVDDPTMVYSNKPSHLFHAFQQWCVINGEPTTDTRRFRGMIERTPRLQYKTVDGIQWVRGIMPKPAPDQGAEAGVEASGGLDS